MCADAILGLLPPEFDKSEDRRPQRGSRRRKSASTASDRRIASPAVSVRMHFSCHSADARVRRSRVTSLPHLLRKLVSSGGGDVIALRNLSSIILTIKGGCDVRASL